MVVDLQALANSVLQELCEFVSRFPLSVDAQNSMVYSMHNLKYLKLPSTEELWTF